MSAVVNQDEMVPRLETERLRLRGHRPEDFENCVALWSNEDVLRYVGGKVMTREEVWARLLRYVGHWMWMGYGYWAVEEKATGNFVGEVGYAMHKRQMEPALGDCPELGWVLAPRFHGRGYATEAARTAMQWGEQQFRGQETVCIIAPENGKSIRVAEKCGFRELARTTYKGEPTILFVH